MRKKNLKSKHEDPAIAAQRARVSALLGGAPSRKLRNKPMPLDAELKAQAKFRRERWIERSKYTDAILAPLQKILAADEAAVKAIKALQQLKPRTRPVAVKLHTPPVRSHIRAGSIITVLVPPYDFGWTTPSSTLGGGIADNIDGQFVINNSILSGGGTVSTGAGLGVMFQPVAENTYVRFSAYVPGKCKWDDHSRWGYTAHNDAFIGVLVESFDLDGNDHQVNVDSRTVLWSDGTGWTEEHGNNDEFPVSFSSDTYFHADSDRQYRVWTWAYATCEASSGFFGNATSSSQLVFPVKFCVFEQWT
jgi:hypothetical protein